MARYYGLNYGPVLEKTMPYSNKADLIDISKINRAPVVNVNDIYVNETIDKGACSNDVILTIKKYIYTKSTIEKKKQDIIEQINIVENKQQKAE